MSDSVSLTFPRDSRYYAVARLVVGGMAAPLQMSYDALDDLQLAISSLLDHDDLDTRRSGGGTDGDAAGEVKLELAVDDARLVAAIGCFEPGSVDRAFDRGSHEAGEIGLRRLLDTIVDDVSVQDRDGGEWVTLTKQVKALAT